MPVIEGYRSWIFNWRMHERSGQAAHNHPAMMVVSCRQLRVMSDSPQNSQQHSWSHERALTGLWSFSTLSQVLPLLIGCLPLSYTLFPLTIHSNILGVGKQAQADCACSDLNAHVPTPARTPAYPPTASWFPSNQTCSFFTPAFFFTVLIYPPLFFFGQSLTKYLRSFFFGSNVLFVAEEEVFSVAIFTICRTCCVVPLLRFLRAGIQVQRNSYICARDSTIWNMICEN